ncbi:MAG: hypothetical protein KatS3mg110_3657 [Pirellulaceae bacterium]|nr:MAG: hypothetical protein KatS3mg110_3657 [Pirellulaceae bacterium]
MLSVRLAWAAALITPALLLAVLDYRWGEVAPGIWLYPLGAALTLLAVWELHGLCQAVFGSPPALLWLLAAACPMAAMAVPVYQSLVGLSDEPLTATRVFGCYLAGQFVGLVLVWIAEMGRFRQPGGQAILRLAGTAWSVVYVTVPLAFLLATRCLASNEQGMFALVTLVVTVKLSDSGAYFVGSTLGRRKLAFYLSPNKTIEGAIGGVVFAVAAVLLLVALIRPWLVPHAKAPHWTGWAVLGVTLAVAAAAGDLAESLVKRDVQQKDSGRWLPGLGGALDLLDSLLWSAAVNYAFWAFGWVE